MKRRSNTIAKVKKHQNKDKRKNSHVQREKGIPIRKYKDRNFQQAHVTITKFENQNQVAQKGPNQPVKNVSLGYSPIRTGVR